VSDEVKVVNAGGGISFFGLLGVVFITLKLCGVIGWSWWLVLLPLYGPLALVLGIVLVVMIIMLIAAVVAKMADR
jgi:hypothetical protein